MKDLPHADVLIVGAGSAGCVLASRLSERGGTSVLVLEEGPVLVGADRPERLRDVGTLPSPVADRGWTRWSDASISGERVAAMPSGRTAGGSSSVNGASFIRGTRSDFDRWAAAGNDEWSFERVLPSFRRIESDLDFGADPWHGSDGPVSVRRVPEGEWSPVSVAFDAAARDLGASPEPDKNAPSSPPGLGVGPVPLNALDGRRVDAATAWIEPHLDRPSLVVRGGVRVRRVVIEHGRAIGVEIDAGRTSKVVRAGHVVLSAGAVESAALLLRSGVGPAADLLGHGIDVVVDAPAVGRLWNHPGLDVLWHPTGEGYPFRGAAPGPGFEVVLHSDLGIEVLAVTRPYGVATGDRPDDRTLSLRVGIQAVRSRGRVSLESANPHVPPVVELRHLEHVDDLALARRGVRLACRLLDSPAFAPLVAERSGPSAAELAQDELLDAWLADHVGTAMHPAGTAAMGGADDRAAVVDQRGRVHGVDGLSVVDTSIMPAMISRGTAATALMIGEHVAALRHDL